MLRENTHKYDNVGKNLGSIEYDNLFVLELSEDAKKQVQSYNKMVRKEGIISFDD